MFSAIAGIPALQALPARAFAAVPFQDADADNLAATALAAFNAGENEFSATKWKELLDKYPSYPNRPQALYNLGLCQSRLNQHSEAISSFQSAIAALPAESKGLVAGAHFFLGYSQLQAGRELASRDAKKADQLLTTATVTFSRLLKDHPQYENNHEAGFYQASAFEDLKRLEEARAAYALVAGNPKATFRLDALHALGELDLAAGALDRAAASFAEYLKDAGTGRVANEVRFRAAQTHWQLALAADNRGDRAAFDREVAESRRWLDPLNIDQTFHIRDQSLFLAAVQASHLDEHQRSAELFQAAAEVPDSPARARALLNAGIKFAAAGQTAASEKNLQAAIGAGDPAISPQAAHELSRLWTREKKFSEAARIAADWVGRAGDSSLKPELMFDQAEATMNLADGRAEAGELFLRLVAEAPQSAAAPLALYNAAWVAMQAGDTSAALELAARFEKEYSAHEYLPFVHEVRAEAEAVSGDSRAAIATLTGLLERNPQHRLRSTWSVSLAAEQVRAGDYPAAAANASAVAADESNDPGLRADASYWAALASYSTRDLAAAEKLVNQARELSRNHSRADLAAGLAAEIQAAGGHWQAADESFAEYRRAFPESRAIADTAFRIATLAFDGGQFAEADRWYSRIRSDFPQSPLLAPSIAGSAWSQLKQDRHEEAARLFREVVDRHGEHAAAKDAARGLAIALRTGGKEGAAIAELEKQLAAADPSADSTDLRYELILALVQAKEPQRVATEIRALLEMPGSRRIADRLHYELAWALLGLEKQEEALDQFRLLTRDHPASPVAGDAFLQLGEHAYRGGEYAEAIGHYRSCLGVGEAPASVREVAAYKMGWSLFRTGDYSAAGRQFDDALAGFPGGKYDADTRFMQAECLFMQDRFEEAAAGFLSNKKLFQESTQIQPANRRFAWLHGAQASNQVRQFEQAVEFAELLTADVEAPAALREDAWLEIGNARRELKQLDLAVEAWTRASVNTGKTGARARCLIGDRLFVDRKFDEAIHSYKSVIYGYGASDKDPEIDPWQAYAIYEAAICHTVQIETATGEMKSLLIQRALALFEQLEKEHPGDLHVAEAKKNIQKLKRLAGVL